jgi:prepilin-type N-terminal cleavage/methylation domain-containing protein
MKNKFKNNRGFTLLELSIVMLLMSIVMTAVLNFIVFGNLITFNEKESYQEKEDINTITKLFFQDMYSIKSVHVENTDNSDVMMYETSEGNIIGYRFKEDEFYEIIDGKEKLIATGQKVDTSKDSVYIENGLVVFNYYFKDSNIMWDFNFRPRLFEVTNDEEE